MHVHTNHAGSVICMNMHANVYASLYCFTPLPRPSLAGSVLILFIQHHPQVIHVLHHQLC
jgi:hypothetical protein